MADEMDIQIRCSSGKAFGWRGSKASSVAEFKDQIAGDAAVPAAEQRLIYKGRALQDAQLLAELDIEDGGTVHLLRAVARAPAPRAPTLANPAGGGGLDLFGGGMGPGMSQADMQRRLMADPEAMSRVLNSPLTRSLMENPALMQSIVQSNPQLQRAMEQNPQLRHALTDPNLLREAVEVARSPARLRVAMRHQDLALSQLENHPEGFNALRRMYNEVQEPLFDSLDNMGGTGGGGGAAPASAYARHFFSLSSRSSHSPR
ncbi:hypothetical protein JL721_8546 [Aureococcus anophagefferens]|nr:hypothetical protein JL721_8546 [Aureococcus anophagefferens]